MFEWIRNLLNVHTPQTPVRRYSGLVLPEDIEWEQSPVVQLNCWIQVLSGLGLRWQSGEPAYYPSLEQIAETGIAACVLPNPAYREGIFDFSEEYLFVSPGEEVPNWKWHSSDSSRLVQACLGKRSGQSVTLSGCKGDTTYEIIAIYSPRSEQPILAHDYGWSKWRRAHRDVYYNHLECPAHASA